MPYQSFDGEKGNSDSDGKFKSLRISPEMVSGKTIVDIGCNEGYFSFKMAEMGARKVVGIDKGKHWKEAADKRNSFDNVEIINDDVGYLSNIESGSVDIVLTLSTMHYLCNPENRNEKGIPNFLVEVERILSNGGVFVFEGGIDQKDTNEFVRLKRSIGDIVYHPTKNKMEDILKQTFSSFKFVGPSVHQGGDPVPRFVYMGVK